MGVRGDEKRLRQVLLNLLGNAVKFTETGGVTLKLGYDESARGSSPLRFQVEDTGMGIPSDKLEEIFQPFQQVGDQSRQVEGTGLGLAITKKLVGLMGGTLGVTSRLGKGSRFWVTVDLPTVQDWRDSAPVKERNIFGFKGTRKRILVVDDKPENRAVLLTLLAPLGFEVFEATDGQDSLAQAAQHRPDLVFMDLVMPVKDGIEATRRIRESSELNNILVIASSASAFDFNRQDCFAAGCYDFLPKPVRADDLFEKLRVHLEVAWVYESEPPPEQAEEPVDASVLAPLREELLALLNLSKKGKITGIRERITKIEQMGDPYRPFAAELQRLAKSFDMRELREFLRPYVQEPQ